MKLSLMKKLMFGFGVVSLFLLAVGLVGVWSVNSTTEAYKPIADVALPRTMAVGDMRANALDVIRLLNQLNFMGAAPEEVDRVDKKVTSAIEMYQKSEQEYLKYMSPAGKPYYDKVKAAMDLVLADIEKYRPLAKSSSLGDKIDFAKAYEGDFKNHRQALYAAFDELLKIQKEVVDKSILEASDKANHMRWLTIILVAAGFVLALAMGYFISRWLSASISRIVDNLSSQAENVEDISKNIAQASQSLAASTSQQAAALQETTSALEQSSAMIKKNADNAQESTQVSEHSLNAVGVGKQAADEMLNAMDVISQSNDAIMDQIIQSNQELTEIVKVISDIGNKTKVINEIVFQTKLLSFNASVEAARAGEHGKGFAVVAEEVGSLAQMSGNAAKEISDMLGASLSRVESIVNNTKSRVEALIADGKTKVDEGKLTAQKCGQALDEIVENVSKISAMITEISTASQEQSKGISEINKAMSELDNSAQQSNAGSQVASSAAESLQHQVNNLRGMVIDLNALLTGENDQTDQTDQTDQQHLQAS